ncbi:WD40/YVTN/BNR-like repeat-containing protein [Variovorax sp. LT1R16]|uniref:WD40/YVTN/BNR-like repeat-containing protein n=1 Tax=Variovorax sp. LT1R16 TaxID=3443728 RepID=UPI003F478A28
MAAPASREAAAGVVGDALTRPALPVRHPGQVMLLSAAAAGRRLVVAGERGVLAVSDDGAASWQQVGIPVSVTLTMVRFADERHGVVIGHGGTVLTTSDGGSTWTQRLDGRRMADIALAAALASGDAARIREAEGLVADGPDKPLLDVAMFDARRMLVIGAYGLVFGTEDGGATWQPWMSRLDNPRALHLYTLRRAGDTLLIAGEQGLLLKSDDAGKRFERLASPYKGSFFTAEMPTPRDLVVAGMRGNVWRSPDGGRSWHALATPAPVSITASALRPDGTLVLATQAGTLLEGRESLQALATPPLPPLNAALVLDNGSLLALGLQGARLLPADGAQGSAK